MAEQRANVERVELDLDEGVARWLRGCARQRGVEPAAVVAELLREARQREVEALLDDAEAERIAAGCP